MESHRIGQGDELHSDGAPSERTISGSASSRETPGAENHSEGSVEVAGHLKRPRETSLSSDGGSSIFGPPQKVQKIKYKQTTIDTGAKVFIDCKVCGMLYNKTIRSDVKAHDRHHAQVWRGAKPREPNADVYLMHDVDENSQEHLIMVVDRDDPTKWRKYAGEAMEILYEGLGGSRVEGLWSEKVAVTEEDLRDPTKHPRYKVYFHTINGKIVAVLLAGTARLAGDYHFGEHNFETNPTRPNARKVQEFVYLDPGVEVFVCIDRIWVHPDHRMKGYATKLVDCVRATFDGDRDISRGEIAFSKTTTEGDLFATAYCKGVFGDLDYVVDAAEVSHYYDGGYLYKNHWYFK